MAESSQWYRVKVLVDGKWRSTGDFRDLEQARQQAQKLALYIDRQVEIRDAADRCLGRGGLSLTEDGEETLVFEEDSSGKTVLLD